jgi:lysophospholipase L1-like esterase
MRRPALWLALALVSLTAGCAAWKLRESAALVRASTPFQANPATATGSLLVVGDSTAVGTGASAPAHSVAGLAARDQPGLRVVNRAEDGADYAAFARQLAASEGRFDTVLVLGGGNDVIRGTPEDKLRASVREVAELARQRGARVILMPPGNVGNAPFFFRPLAWWMTRRSQLLHAAVREAAGATGASYVNLYQPREQDPFARQPEALHAADGLHPSDSGYALWWRELARQVPGAFAPRADAPARPAARNG